MTTPDTPPPKSETPLSDRAFDGDLSVGLQPEIKTWEDAKAFAKRLEAEAALNKTGLENAESGNHDKQAHIAEIELSLAQLERENARLTNRYDLLEKRIRLFFEHLGCGHQADRFLSEAQPPTEPSTRPKPTKPLPDCHE